MWAPQAAGDLDGEGVNLVVIMSTICIRGKKH